MVSNSYDEVVRYFEENGWKEYPVGSHNSHDRQWLMRFPLEPRCRGNEDKPLQVRAMLWDHRKYGEPHIGLELDLTAQPSEENGWVVLKAYAFDSVDDVDNQCDRLLTAWRAISEGQ